MSTKPLQFFTQESWGEPHLRLLNLVGGWVSTHLKNMLVKMGSSSPIFGVKIPRIFELPPTSNFLPLQVSGCFRGRTYHFRSLQALCLAFLAPAQTKVKVLYQKSHWSLGEEPFFFWKYREKKHEWKYTSMFGGNLIQLNLSSVVQLFDNKSPKKPMDFES